MNALRLAGSLALILAGTLATGCTYALKESPALYSYQQVEGKFLPLEKDTLEEAVSTALQEDSQGEVRGNSRYHISRNDWGWAWVEDRIEYRRGLTVEVPETDDEPARTIQYRDNVLLARGTGIPSLIFGKSDYHIYDRETGEAYARMRSTSAILSLIYWGEVIKPTARALPLPDTMGPLSWEPDQYNYTKSSGTALIWGLLAAGQKNGRAYAQVLWIPIPLWATEPTPDPVEFDR
ncbi:MAG: hypothetical protein JJU11_03045 [Candidatus Sumerlaeia bacterium]|nr:hypothetical protein [Candidatus Sumerlaeia bacterium]